MLTKEPTRFAEQFPERQSEFGNSGGCVLYCACLCACTAWCKHRCQFGFRRKRFVCSDAPIYQHSSRWVYCRRRRDCHVSLESFEQLIQFHILLVEVLALVFHL